MVAFNYDGGGSGGSSSGKRKLWAALAAAAVLLSASAMYFAGSADESPVKGESAMETAHPEEKRSDIGRTETPEFLPERVYYPERDRESRGTISSINSVFGMGNTLLALQYGPFVPLGSYRSRMEYAYSPGLSLNLGDLEFLSLIPSLHYQYARLESRDRAGYVDSRMELSQFMAGLSFRYGLDLSGLLSASPLDMKELVVFASVRDGVSRISYRNDRTRTPLVEYVHTFGVSAGIMYPVFAGVNIGIEAGYQYIATKGEPLQSAQLMVRGEVQL